MDLNEQLTIVKRGTVEIISEEELTEKLERSSSAGVPLKIKAGFDPTAPDIHLGHTVLIQKMRHFQDLGHEVIFLVGDFTAMIGDPSGRSEIRKPLSKDEILVNAGTYRDQIYKMLDPDKTKIVFNSTWMDKMSASSLIELSSRYTVARMLERDDFDKRYRKRQPISIHEFIYPLIQGYDSVMLKADIELGGTDQKFNLLVGRELQRDYGQGPQVIITVPILEGTDGIQKMSKSLGNYIGIDESPKEMFGKIMSLSDELMMKYYELLSDITLNELADLKNGIKDGSLHPMDIKKRLASEIIERFHNRAAAIYARREFENVFRDKRLPDRIPEFRLKWDKDKMWLPHIIVASGMINSSSEARRLIRQGAVSVDGEKVIDINMELGSNNKEYIIKIGKKRFVKIIPE